MARHAVSVIGAGQMGYGLCVQFALCGQDVTLIDHHETNLEAARNRIESAVSFLDSEGLANAAPAGVVDEIVFTIDLADGVTEPDIVLETVSEDLDTKHAVFEAVVEHVPEDAVLTTNTSSLRITDIAAGVPDDAGRVAGCHWWNPPYLLSPVEVVRGEGTTDGTIDRITEFVESVERDPVLVERDVLGFVWNRIQFAVLRECISRRRGRRLARGRRSGGAGRLRPAHRGHRSLRDRRLGWARPVRDDRRGTVPSPHG
jgi:3-hydroxyacyl-CoA dehydrogenase